MYGVIQIQTPREGVILLSNDSSELRGEDSNPREGVIP